MKKIIILGLGVAAFFMQGCDFLDRTPEDIIETGKFFESANANALEPAGGPPLPRPGGL